MVGKNHEKQDIYEFCVMGVHSESIVFIDDPTHPAEFQNFHQSVKSRESKESYKLVVGVDTI